MLNLYFTCTGLSDKLTVEILRKMIFIGVSDESGKGAVIGLHQLKKAILFCTEPQERLAYCQHLIYLYEDDGRKFLETLAMEHEEIKILFNQQ